MSKIVRYTNPWNEWRDLNALSRVMDRWVNEAFGDRMSVAWNNGYNVDAPSLDVAETPEAYTVKASLPGWKPEDVDITFENGVVTLKGELKSESENGNGEAPEKNTDPKTKYHFKEIRKASFYRQLSLPTEVQAEKASAQFENGLLTLTLPKAEVVKPKQIKIAAK